MTTTTPLPAGTKATWQPPYHDPEPVTVLAWEVKHLDGSFTYSVRCQDGSKRLAHSDDLGAA
jgi:hypothetical protein